MADIRIVPAQGAINVTGSADFKGTGGSTILYLTGSGQIGAGTISPDSEFHIVGSGTRFVTLDRSGTRSYDLGVNSSGTFLVTDNTAAADRISLSVSGSVGIGTTNPSQLLHLVNASGPVIRLVRSSNRFDFEADTNSAGIVSRDSATAAFSITGFGNVGIGSASPAVPLDVVGKIRSVNANDQLTIKRSDNTGTRIGHDALGLYFANDDAALAVLRIYGGTSGAERLAISSGGALKLSSYGSGTITGTAAYNLSVDSSGNIIETANPSLTGTGTTNYVTKWSGGNSLTDSVIYDSGTAIGIGTNSPSTFFHVSTASTEIARFQGDTGGVNSVFRIQIGSVSDSFASGSRTFLGDGGTDIILGTANSSYTPNNSYISLNYGGNIYMGAGASPGLDLTLNTDGNVGIGTTNPGAKLHIQGTSGTFGILKTTGVADAGWSVQGYDAYYALGDATNGNRWYIWNDGVSATSKLSIGNAALGTWYTDAAQVVTILNSGNVGIGITNPSEKLQVIGAIKASRTTGASENILIYPQTAAKWGSTTYPGVIESSGNNSMIIGSGQNVPLYLARSGAIALTVGTGGNIGIGDTNPNQKLVVAGNIAVSASNSTGAVWFGTGQNIGLYRDNTYDLVLTQQEASGNPVYVAGAGDVIVSIDSNDNETTRKFIVGSNAVKASNELFSVNESGNVYIGNDLTVTGKITAREFHTTFVSASIIYQSGSTKFGDSADDLHTFQGNATFGIPGNGSNTSGRYLSIEGNTDASGEGSSRIFFAEHNSSTAAMSSYGMSLGYRGGDTSIVGADGNTWTGLSSISNGQWGMWGHDADATGAVIMYGDRAATFVNLANNDLNNVGNAYFNGNVGIGTNNPSKKLHVTGDAWINRPSNKVDNNGATEFGSRVEFNNAFATNQSGYMVFRYPSYNNFLIGGDYDGNIGGAIPNIQFGRSSGTVYMHIASSDGNVGIGTTSPGYILDTVGSPVRHTRSGKSIIINPNYGAADINADLQTDSGMDLTLSPAGTERVRVTTSGSVGIGITAPTARLHVTQGFTTTNLAFAAGTTGYAIANRQYDTAVIQQDDVTTLRLVERVDGSDNDQVMTLTIGDNYGRIATSKQPLQFFVSGSSTGLGYQGLSGNLAMHMALDGNIGVGTSNPTYKLHVVGGAALVNSGIIAGDSKFYNSVQLTDSLGGTTQSWIWAGATDSLYMGIGSVGAGNTKMVISSSGYVGIGTASPADKLEIYSGTYHKIKTFFEGSYTSGFKFSDYNGGIRYDAGNDRLTLFANYLGGVNAPEITFETSGSERMRIDAVGNVGIGTANPEAKLDVRAGSGYIRLGSYNDNYHVKIEGGDQLNFRNGANPAVAYIQYAGPGDSLLGRNLFVEGNSSGGATGAVRIKSDGNVGIGVTNPDRWLTVLRSGAANGTQQQVALFANNATGATSAAIYIGAYTGTDWLIGKNIYGASSLTNFQIGDQAVSTSYIDIATGGNVGIGTTSPAAKLHAVGTNGAIQVGGSGYTLHPSGMQLGQYVAGMGYIQAPSGGRVEIWNGATENIVNFNNDKSSEFFGSITAPSFTGDIYTNSIYKKTNGSPIVINAGLNASRALRVYYDMDVYNGINWTDASWNAQGSISGTSGVMYYNANTRHQFNGKGIVLTGDTNYVVSGSGGGYPTFYGNSSSAQIGFGRTGNSEGTSYLGSDATYLFRLWDASFGQGYLNVQRSDGNIGVGVTSPAYKLDISGSTRIQTIDAAASDTDKFLVSDSGVVKYRTGAQVAQDLDSYTQTFYVADTSGTGQWVRLGTWTAAQGGNVVTVRVSQHAGYNAATNQNQEIYIFMKTSNGSSVDASGFAGDSTFWTEGLNTSVSEGDVIWEANAAGVSATAYTLFVNLGPYTNASQYTVTTRGGTWSNNTTTTSPSGTSSSSTILLSERKFSLNDVLFTNGGSIGIGTSGPTGLLDVRGTSYFRGSYSGATIAPTALGADMYFYQGNSPVIYLQSGDHIIFNNGYGVGIGTNSPASKLDVRSSSTEVVRIYGDTGDTNGLFRIQMDSVSDSYGSGARTFLGDGGTDIILGTSNSSYTPANSYIALNHGGSIYMGAGASPGLQVTLDTNGNVGIGTSTPIGGKLHVYNSTGVFEGPSSGASTISSSTFGIQVGPTHDRSTTSNVYYPGIAFNHLLNYNGGTTYNVAPQGWIGLRLYDTPGSERSSLVFATKEGTGTTNAGTDIPTERMCINPFGNVGIGTTGPNSRLDVSLAEGTYVRATNASSGVGAGNYWGFGLYEGTSLSAAFRIVRDGTGDQVSIGTANNQSFAFWQNNTERMRIAVGGNVGIGTTNPGYILDIRTTSTEDAQIAIRNTSTGNAKIYFDASNGDLAGSDYASIGQDNDLKFYVRTDTNAGDIVLSPKGGSGNVGIGSASPAYKLDVAGTIRATGDVIAYSDARVKENVLTLENSLELVKKLRGVSYNKIGESEKKVGVIAQEVLQVLPEVVSQDSEGTYSVAYGNITAVLIEAIKQQQQQIDELKAEIKQLKG